MNRWASMLPLNAAGRPATILLGQQIGDSNRIIDVGIAPGGLRMCCASLDDAGFRPCGHGAVWM
jgi:hypothetical protein